MSGDTQANTSYTTAADLPPELIRNILDEVVASYSGLGPLSYSKHDGLSVYGLTCRRWAGAVRPLIFRDVKLKQPEDIVQLLEFLDSDISVVPALSDCIEYLTVEVDPAALVGAVPCFHHYDRLVKRLRTFSLPGASLKMRKGQDPINGESSSRLEIRSLLRVLSSSLPKTLPGALFPFNDVTLNGLRLRSSANLAYTVNSLPTVRLCYCSDLTFTEDPATPRLRIRRRLSKLIYVSVSRCGDGRLKTQLELCSMVADVRERLGFSADAWAGVCGTVSTVPDGDASASVYLLASPKSEYSCDSCDLIQF
jgi:hypothetical protein